MKLLDLFSGIGGFPKGIEQAGIKIKEHYYSEIDKYAKAIYRKHWPQAIDLGAVESIDGSRYEPFDLITFGFPCQDISIAGRREGLSGARSNLFFEATRIIRENKPSAFIFENVKGLFSSNNGKDFISVLREIADIGLYECQWQLLNTSWFLPQFRERVYFAGYDPNRSTREIFPIGEAMREITEEGKERGNGLICLFDGDYQSHRVYADWGISPTIPTSGGGHHIPFIFDSRYQRVRQLTPLECERLQGFSDFYTVEGAEMGDISDSQRYKALGNAVTTNAVQAIMEKWKTP